jgi:hypothetical protein
MKRALIISCMLCGVASAHVGSPDVFFDGHAGPYELFVTIRMPKVIPGVAQIEIRASSPDVASIEVQPLRLTGPGSERPPTADPAERAPADPQFFTASSWLMERGSMQVRITAHGARGNGVLGVPVPAIAQTTLGMSAGLGALLISLMIVLAVSLVAIVVAAKREATLAPGEPARPRGRITLVVVSAMVIGVIALGRMWWSAVATDYAQLVYTPWQVEPKLDGCTLSITTRDDFALLPDHGHDMHLFLVRMPELDRLAHLHPERRDHTLTQHLPSLPAGHYKLYADIVLRSGFPLTGTADVDLPELQCGAPSGDDTVWSSADSAHVIWDRPARLRADVALPLAFHVEPGDGLEPYMGMVAHAEVIKTDGSVFAHLHPNGSVAMPALELADTSTGAPSMAMAMAGMPGMAAMSPKFTIPFGFPQPGDYRVFVQIKRNGAIETASFEAHVDSP